MTGPPATRPEPSARRRVPARAAERWRAAPKTLAPRAPSARQAATGALPAPEHAVPYAACPRPAPATRVAPGRLAVAAAAKAWSYSTRRPKQTTTATVANTREESIVQHPVTGGWEHGSQLWPDPGWAKNGSSQ